MNQLLERIYETAKAEAGTEEVMGEAHNPRILEYHAATNGGASSDETPWCSAFACWVLKQCGISNPRSAWARSFLSWGVPIDEPRRGCIVVLSRNETSGHVGFFDSIEGKNVILLGGNQNNRVGLKAYPLSRLLGYRIPKVKEPTNEAAN